MQAHLVQCPSGQFPAPGSSPLCLHNSFQEPGFCWRQSSSQTRLFFSTHRDYQFLACRWQERVHREVSGWPEALSTVPWHLHFLHPARWCQHESLNGKTIPTPISKPKQANFHPRVHLCTLFHPQKLLPDSWLEPWSAVLCWELEQSSEINLYSTLQLIVSKILLKFHVISP